MNTMVLALQITALGMGLVFAAIILLWWMMNLLTFVTAEKEPRSEKTELASEKIPAALDDELRAQAAAVGVAMALAEQEGSTPHLWTEPPPVIVSAFQLGMRTRQMYQKGNSIRRRVRQDDK